MNGPLNVALERALRSQAALGVAVADLTECTPSTAPDLFSNDYLSITLDTELHRSLLQVISSSSAIFGARGSRLLNGNSEMHVQFETRMKEVFDAPATLLCNSGYDANISLLSSLPQSGDAIIFDELSHASTRHAISISRAKDVQYAFEHNSVMSFKLTLELVLQRHRNISEGKGTVFIVVESLYSIDGDFAPLLQIVNLVDELIPKGCAHIIVDEAHSTGIYGDKGRGIVSMLGLSHCIHTVLHAFGKAHGLSGAVLLTSQLVKMYIVNFSRPFIFSTAPPHMHILALNTSFDYIMSPKGSARMERLQYLCLFFEMHLVRSLASVPNCMLDFRQIKLPAEFPTNIRLPIFPIFTSMPLCLSRYLRSIGYACQALPFPVVPKGTERIRVIVHAANTESELEIFVHHLVTWAETVHQNKAVEQCEGSQSAKL